jgi:hypothetical protein
MLSLIAALAAAAPAPARPADDPDFRCMVAASLVLDRMAADGKATPEDKSGVASVFMYYLGKIDARFPAVDYVEEVSVLVGRPGYAATTLGPDLARCGREATQRGRALEQMGKALQARAVPGESKPD